MAPSKGCRKKLPRLVAIACFTVFLITLVQRSLDVHRGLDPLAVAPRSSTELLNAVLEAQVSNTRLPAPLGGQPAGLAATAAHQAKPSVLAATAAPAAPVAAGGGGGGGGGSGSAPGGGGTDHTEHLQDGDGEEAEPGEPEEAAAPAHEAEADASAGSGGCQRQAKAQKTWRQVGPKYFKHIRTLVDKRGITRCDRRGDALVFHLDMKAAKKVGGKAYELPFPEYIVSDEMGGGWREKRSTLQLFAAADVGRLGRPLGPAHADHSVIANTGNGAYSHWREAITGGPYGKPKLRFSLPKNVPLKKFPGLIAVVFPMAPPMGWIEFTRGKKVKHQELFRELYFRTFPTAGVEPHVIDRPEDVRAGTWYLWRVGGNHEFELPLQPGEVYERRLPYQIAEYYGEYERQGGILFPPPASYVYYQNKVALAKLFKDTGVRTPLTWVFANVEEALAAQNVVQFPVVVKDPYGFSSHGIQQAASWDEFTGVVAKFFQGVAPGIEAIVQQKVVALREARVSYIDGRPFHGYWRVRQSLASASAASNLGGYQSFDFPLKAVAASVERFANMTGVPVGGVDWIWKEQNPDPSKEAYTLEVSPTSDLNPPSPPDWKKTYAEFKLTDGYRPAYVAVRRSWTDLMVLAVIDRYRQSKKHLFVDIDNVVSQSAARVLRLKGGKRAYTAVEVLRDEPVPDAAAALRALRPLFFIRFLTARRTYEDAFNVTQTWLHRHGFEYDELIVVNDAEDKVAHLRSDSLLVDDFTVGHDKATPRENLEFMATLRKAGLPFVQFPFGGRWAEVQAEVRAFAGVGRAGAG